MNKYSNGNNYNRIAAAITYISDHFKDQPSLDLVASKLNLSPFHFQRLFTEWAGISPKKFLQYISVSYAKSLLKENQATLFDVAHEAGLSSTSRVHDLFVNIEAMTPGEFKNGGKGLCINYSFSESCFGELIIASTPKGVCHIAFSDDKTKSLLFLKEKFPEALYYERTDIYQQSATHLFKNEWKGDKVKLHLKGTDFQLKVWEALLKIPEGKLVTYGSIAKQINSPSASRAVGTAIGDNPIAFLIPCHRVIQSNGLLGGYMWGTTRKAAIIGWEAARLNHKNKEE